MSTGNTESTSARPRTFVVDRAVTSLRAPTVRLPGESFPTALSGASTRSSSAMATSL